MSTQTMLERYPWMRQQVAATPKQQLPDYEPSTGDVLNRTVGPAALGCPGGPLR